jgi:hypothetical protein
MAFSTSLAFLQDLRQLIHEIGQLLGTFNNCPQVAKTSAELNKPQLAGTLYATLGVLSLLLLSTQIICMTYMRGGSVRKVASKWLNRRLAREHTNMRKQDQSNPLHSIALGDTLCAWITSTRSVAAAPYGYEPLSSREYSMSETELDALLREARGLIENDKPSNSSPIFWLYDIRTMAWKEDSEPATVAY